MSLQICQQQPARFVRDAVRMASHVVPTAHTHPIMHEYGTVFQSTPDTFRRSAQPRSPAAKLQKIAIRYHLSALFDTSSPWSAVDNDRSHKLLTADLRRRGVVNLCLVLGILTPSTPSDACICQQSCFWAITCVDDDDDDTS